MEEITKFIIKYICVGCYEQTKNVIIISKGNRSF